MDAKKVTTQLKLKSKASFVVDKNGISELFVDGYTFSCYHADEAGEKNWRCTSRGCGAKVYTIDDEKIVSTSALRHNHEPPKVEIKEEPEDKAEDDHQYDLSKLSPCCSVVCSLQQFPNFVGEYNFELVPPQRGRFKPSWEFSYVLNQIFVKMNKVLMLQFVFDAPPRGTEFFIRAMPVYGNEEFAGFPVYRCKFHSFEDDPNNQAHTIDDKCFCKNYNYVGHVIKSRSSGAIFCYDHSSKRHSVSVPAIAHHQGRNSFEIIYSFHCKTYCQKGMQRRPIKVVFTLENKTGEILGRSAVAVKISCCPKRDKNNLERDFAKRIFPTRVANISPDPQSDRDMLKVQIKEELKNVYKAKFMYERSLRSMERLLDDL